MVLSILISAKKRTQRRVGFKSIIKLQNHTLFSVGPIEAKFLLGGRRVPYNRKKTIVPGLIKSEKDLANVPFEPHNPPLISRRALKRG